MSAGGECGGELKPSPQLVVIKLFPSCSMLVNSAWSSLIAQSWLLKLSSPTPPVEKLVMLKNKVVSYKVRTYLFDWLSLIASLVDYTSRLVRCRLDLVMLLESIFFCYECTYPIVPGRCRLLLWLYLVIIPASLGALNRKRRSFPASRKQ